MELLEFRSTLWGNLAVQYGHLIDTVSAVQLYDEPDMVRWTMGTEIWRCWGMLKVKYLYVQLRSGVFPHMFKAKIIIPLSQSVHLACAEEQCSDQA